MYGSDRAQGSRRGPRNNVTYSYLFSGADPGGMEWVASQPPSLGSFKLEITKGYKAIIEAILSLTVSVPFCQVRHPSPPPPFKNPGSATDSLFISYLCT